jgi:uncharacterized protein YlbG (UPF0298 family)
LIEEGEEGAVIVTNLKTFISHQILLLLHNQIDQILKKKKQLNCVKQVIGSVKFIEFTPGGQSKQFFMGTEPA